MQQVVIATRKRDSEAVITALQDAGVLHLKPLTEGPLNTGSLAGQDAQHRREDERLLARAESTIAELGAYRPAPAPLPAQAEAGPRLTILSASLEPDVVGGLGVLASSGLEIHEVDVRIVDESRIVVVVEKISGSASADRRIVLA